MEKPVILFLQETKCSSEDMENSSKRFWKGAQVVTIEAEGSTRGIGLL